ncbi:MAG: bifunctional adenosylcobinamide kinase/adenosylcobinamide-phosphate guanylyltransferase [Rhodospirillales bacterium]|nr:bifunctional adenosylcobinamide kinase/adenosylcobinamide-phosphate guanylyltransferase [Rhodospirillales bacterium]
MVLTPASLAPLTLVLGGQRSGKSAYAESLIGHDRVAVYVATAEAGDREMAARIEIHRQRRGASWTTVEEPLDLAGALKALDGGVPVLVDCLSIWAANLLAAGRDVAEETAGLVAVVKTLTFPVVMVSSETGLGVIPANALARAYLDAAGAMNQTVAAAAKRVVLVVAGIPVTVKEETS